VRAINFFILFLLVESFQLFSFLQAQNINASVNRNSILIGEQIKLVLTADNVDVKKHPIVQWPQIPDSFNHFEVIEKGKIDTVSKNGVNHYEQTHILTSFDEGSWDIPAFNVLFSKKSTRNRVSLHTPSIKIKVYPADISRLKNYHDIKDIVQTPKESAHSQKNSVIGLIGLIAVIVLIIVSWAVLKRRRIKRIALAIGFKTSTKGWDILNEIDLPENWLIIINSSKNHFNTENYKPKKIIKDSTHFIDLQRDFLSDKDLSLLFYASDVVLLPYKVSSGSGVMFDALAHGLPFIATDLEFFKEYARKGLGITVKRDPKEFKKALIDLENNYEYYCNSVNQFKLYLNWKNIADYHSNVYNSILVDTKSSESIQHSSTIATTNTTTSTTVLPINKIKNSSSKSFNKSFSVSNLSK